MTGTPTLNVAHPAGFAPIPLNEFPDARAQEARDVLRHVSDLDLPDRSAAIKEIVLLGGTLRDAGISLAGQFTLPDVPASVNATILLSISRLSDRSEKLTSADEMSGATDALADLIRGHHPLALIDRVDLPAAPAVVVHRDRLFELPAATTSIGEQISTPIRSVQYLFLTPGCDRLVTLDASSSSAEHWARFADLAGAMAQSISFDCIDGRA